MAQQLVHMRCVWCQGLHLTVATVRTMRKVLRSGPLMRCVSCLDRILSTGRRGPRDSESGWCTWTEPPSIEVQLEKRERQAHIPGGAVAAPAGLGPARRTRTVMPGSGPAAGTCLSDQLCRLCVLPRVREKPNRPLGGFHVW